MKYYIDGIEINEFYKRFYNSRIHRPMTKAIKLIEKGVNPINAIKKEFFFEEKKKIEEVKEVEEIEEVEENNKILYYEIFNLIKKIKSFNSLKTIKYFVKKEILRGKRLKRLGKIDGFEIHHLLDKNSISIQNFYERQNRGWTIRQACGLDPKPFVKRDAATKYLIEHNGEKMSLKKFYNNIVPQEKDKYISYTTATLRIKKGISPEKAVLKIDNNE